MVYYPLPADSSLENSTRMNPERRTILVADIVGSTHLYDVLGDRRAKTLITDCLNRLTEIVLDHDGAVTASVGDELVCSFPEVTNATTSANEMQAGVHTEVDQTGDIGRQAVQLSIGIQVGDLVTDPFDMTAEVVTIARHLSGLAKAEQSLITQRVHDDLSSVIKAMTRYVDDEPWPSAPSNKLIIHELIWAVSGITAAAPAAAAAIAIAARTTVKRVVLRFKDTEVELGDKRPAASVGRGPHNDIAIKGDLVSREHYRLEIRNGRCTITDYSTNGTSLVADDGKLTYVRRETLPLSGNGTIHFGKDVTKLGVNFSVDAS